jgi:hypothetical protein
MVALLKPANCDKLIQCLLLIGVQVDSGSEVASHVLLVGADRAR